MKGEEKDLDMYTSQKQIRKVKNRKSAYLIKYIQGAEGYLKNLNKPVRHLSFLNNANKLVSAAEDRELKNLKKKQIKVFMESS